MDNSAQNNKKPLISGYKQSGFTLVELLLVVAIIAVFSSFLIPGFSNYIDNQNLKQAQEQLKSDLRTAQSRGLAGVNSTSGVNYWGLKINDVNANSYYFFSSITNGQSDCNSAGLTEKSEQLPGGAVVRNGNGGVDKVCIFFNFRDGDANITGLGGGDTLMIGYTDSTTCQGVQINTAGLVKGVNDIACL